MSPIHVKKQVFHQKVNREQTYNMPLSRPSSKSFVALFRCQLGSGMGDQREAPRIGVCSQLSRLRWRGDYQLEAQALALEARAFVKALKDLLR